MRLYQSVLTERPPNPEGPEEARECLGETGTGCEGLVESGWGHWGQDGWEGPRSKAGRRAGGRRHYSDPLWASVSSSANWGDSAAEAEVVVRTEARGPGERRVRGKPSYTSARALTPGEGEACTPTAVVAIEESRLKKH